MWNDEAKAQANAVQGEENHEQETEVLNNVEYETRSRSPLALETKIWLTVCVVIVIVVLGLLAFGKLDLSSTPKREGTVELSKDERAKALSMQEHLESIDLQRGKLGLDYNAALNRLNEEQNAVNHENEEFVFALKRTHALDPNRMYDLDPYRGQLVPR